MNKPWLYRMEQCFHEKTKEAKDEQGNKYKYCTNCSLVIKYKTK